MSSPGGNRMADGEKYWGVVEPIWDAVEIYEGPDVFLKTFGQVDHKAGLLFAAHFCQSEVCNGGFHQLFSNSAGVLAPEAVEGFTAIGETELAGVISQAMSVLGAPYVRDRAPRRAALDRLSSDSFKELDEKFLALIDTENGGFTVAADNYAAHLVP
jgi:hypothetical protein